MQLLALASLDAITKGHGTAEHIGAISLACNMTGALIRQGIGEEATEIVERCQTALLNADRRFTKLAAGDSAGRNCNTFATCSMFTNGWCRTPHNSKSAARFGILTTASRVAKFCRGLQREPRIWIGTGDAGEPNEISQSTERQCQQPWGAQSFNGKRSAWIQPHAVHFGHVGGPRCVDP